MRPSPSHRRRSTRSRGRAGPELLATILEAKFGQHLPLNRQSETFAREGIALDVSTLADWVGACAAALAPLGALIRAHVLAAERLHGDDTTVPVLAKNRTSIGPTRGCYAFAASKAACLSMKHAKATMWRPARVLAYLS